MPSITDDEVKAILAEEARVPVDRLADPDATLDSLGVASIDVMSSLFTLEDRHGVIVQTEDLEGVTTLGGLLKVVQDKAAA
jgi:acyl carrier protein